ncbi:glucosaminidase domain-containing protein [Marinibaculum pumilum]|uniref:Glucosaminidase domain-containing protein n=1 Tax=Marinibaculum pumilum TaxID=1766165 RepID=A0ABV7L6M2_9PROT
MKRRRSPTSTRAIRTDFARLMVGLGGLALLGLGAGGAVSAIHMDGTPVTPPRFSERPLPVDPDVRMATPAPQDSLPVPEAQGGGTVQARAAHLPAPAVADADADPGQPAIAAGDPTAAAPASANATAALTVGVHAATDDILPAGPAPLPGAPAADAAGEVPDPRRVDREIAPYRLDADPPAPFRLASLLLQPESLVPGYGVETPGGDRHWRRTEDLLAAFGDADYDLRRIRAGESGVPRIFVGALPEDLRSIRHPERRKRTFIKTVLPLVLRANQEVLADRRRLQGLVGRLEAGTPLNGEQQGWLSTLADRYGGSADDPAELLRRVDIVPVSLALAQAAEESGWGTSRFARQGNAVFGQWTWDTEAGIVPRDRPRGRSHLVRKFPALQQSVSAYIDNLNSNPAYASFRKARAGQRSKGAADAAAEAHALDGYALAGHMSAYSERGAAYVRTLRTIIGHNDLQAFDSARLSDTIRPWTTQLAGDALRSVF